MYCSREQQCPNVSYVITATAQGAQTADTPCTHIEIEVNGDIVNKPLLNVGINLFYYKKYVEDYLK